jgi:ADP-ribose pyrophosphatase
VSRVTPWVVEGERTVAETRIGAMRVRRSRSTLRPDRSGDFVAFDFPDWVNVIAFTDAGEVVLVEQWRHGTQEPTLEVPGGMVDPGEDMVAAALRELREETGYAGEGAQLIGVVTPNPALQTNRCGTVVVRGCRLVGAPEPDPNEEIVVSTASLDEVHAMLRDGRIHHALVVAAFLHLSLNR